MKLAIGMPVFERSWVLPLWFQCLEAQSLAPKEDITLCFAYSKGYDGTYEILRHYGEQYGNVMIYDYDLKTYSVREDMSRFHELTALRNGLLSMARETSADYFLSWDNDILFPPGRLSCMFESASEKTAVGALMDMGGRDDVMGHPSVMEFGATPYEVAFRRPFSTYPTDYAFKCDVIMAVKLMGREVYENTEYRWDPIGEDIGWCRDCNEKGYDRYLEPRARGYHLYDKESVIRTLKAHRNMEYPELLGPLSEWYKSW